MILAKRLVTLQNCGLDFLDAPRLFAERSLAIVNDRFDYGEGRFVSCGFIDGAAVALVWTRRNGVMRIISTRKMYLKEIQYVGLD